MKLTVENGSFSYGNSDNLWQGIDFSLCENEILAIMGPNGVGKTTLLKCILQLLPWKTGKTLLDEQPADKLSTRQFWRKISYVPQAKTPSYSFTVEELVLMGRNTYINTFGQPSQKDRELAYQIMSDIGIVELAHKNCQQLSGGQFQLVLIARALCSQPACLILDEPESNLDFRNQLLVLDVMERLAKEKNLICIFNTHYPQHGMRVADYSLLVYQEHEALFGRTNEVVTEENLEKLFKVKVHLSQNDYQGQAYQTVTAINLL